MESFCQVFSTIYDLCSAGTIHEKLRFSQLFLKMWFGRRESRGTIHEKTWVSSVFRKFGSEGKSRGATMAWRERGEILLSPVFLKLVSFALTLTLSPSPKLAFSSIFVSHLPSSSSHFQFLHSTLLHLPPHSFVRSSLIPPTFPAPCPLPSSSSRVSSSSSS